MTLMDRLGSRHSVFRGVTGVIVLTLVMVLELVRHPRDPAIASTSGPADPAAPIAVVPVAPTLAPAPVVARSAPPSLRPAVPSALPAPAVAEAAAASVAPASPPAHLLVDFEHGLKEGSIAVFVDGEPRLQQHLASRVTRRVLAIEFRHGRVERSIEVPPGTRHVRVQVRWDDNLQSSDAVARFRGGRTRRLVAHLAPVTRALRMDWR